MKNKLNGLIVKYFRKNPWQAVVYFICLILDKTKELPMKNMTATKHNNRKMNQDTYKLRREVMSHIYAAKKLCAEINVALPRIDVRITDVKEGCERVLGTARLNDNIVWIPASTVARDDLRQVVFHEILHACYGVEHDKHCPLMSPCIKKLADFLPTSPEKVFLQYVKRNNKR